jgi:hypothetical protein
LVDGVGGRERYVSRWDVLDELLCFGWIYGLRRKLDDERTLQLISAVPATGVDAACRERFERLERDGTGRSRAGLRRC